MAEFFLDVNESIHPKVVFENLMELYHGAHVLYTYTDGKKYIENAFSFISTGLRQGHAVIFIENEETTDIIQQKLKDDGFTQSQLQKIIFVNNKEFYLNDQKVSNRLSELVEPFLSESQLIRTWGNIESADMFCIQTEKLKDERKWDQMIDDVSTFTVCAYNGDVLTASLQNELAKCHSYMMTDSELFSSSIYSKELTSSSLSLEKKLEEENSELKNILAIHKKYYHHLLDQIPDAVMVGAYKKIIYVNEAAGSLLECESEYLLGKNVWDFIHQDDQQLVANRINKFLNEDELPLVEMKIKTFEGNLKDVEVRSFRFFYGNEETTISLLRDIMDRKENEALAIKSEKLSVAGQLAAGIAHEIRNPLTAIKGFLKLWNRECENPYYYSILEKEIDEIEMIASELLVLGKPLSLKKEKLDISEVIKKICTFMRAQANIKNIEINCESVAQSGHVHGIEGQIKQVFINLLKNSIEAMDDGGTITIRTKSKGLHVFIEIEDQGKGIPNQIMERIGEPFYTTKEKGTGLGLMVCYGIIDQHEGEILVHSDDKGTIFTIKLPLIS